jgi:hypothetical protein
MSKSADLDGANDRAGAPRRAPQFKQRMTAAIAAAKAAGASRVKIAPDGSVEIDFLAPCDQTAINDFDRPPNPLPPRRGSRNP